MAGEGMVGGKRVAGEAPEALKAGQKLARTLAKDSGMRSSIIIRRPAKITNYVSRSLASLHSAFSFSFFCSFRPPLQRAWRTVRHAIDPYWCAERLSQRPTPSVALDDTDHLQSNPS